MMAGDGAVWAGGAVVRLVAWLTCVLGALASGSLCFAQAPQHQPLVREGNLVYLGSFRLPTTDGSGRTDEAGKLTFGGAAIGIGPDGRSLYFGCHAWHSRLARVSIPDFDAVASIVSPC
jgi:hypothetical protein